MVAIAKKQDARQFDDLFLFWNFIYPKQGKISANYDKIVLFIFTDKENFMDFILSASVAENVDIAHFVALCCEFLAKFT